MNWEEASKFLYEWDEEQKVCCGPNKDVVGYIKTINIDEYTDPKDKPAYRVIFKIDVKSGIDPKYLIDNEKSYAIYNYPNTLIIKI